MARPPAWETEGTRRCSVTRLNAVLRRRRRLAVALVAALALTPAAAQARPAKWSVPAAPAKWSPPSGSNEAPGLAHIERSSWT
jgi:hypothetical protein